MKTILLPKICLSPHRSGSTDVVSRASPFCIDSTFGCVETDQIYSLGRRSRRVLQGFPPFPVMVTRKSPFQWELPVEVTLVEGHVELAEGSSDYR